MHVNTKKRNILSYYCFSSWEEMINDEEFQDCLSGEVPLFDEEGNLIGYGDATDNNSITNYIKENEAYV